MLNILMKQKIILITGAAKGIGLQAASTLGKLGHYIIITARDTSKGQAALDRLRKEGSEAHFIQMDVTDEAMIHQVVDQVEKLYNRLDVLVNNAGILKDRLDSLQVSRQSVQEHLDTNFIGALLVSQACYPLLLKSKEGRIINVSSQMGRLNGMGSGSAAYRFSKTAMNSLTATMAADLANTNIKVNCLHPGWVRSDMGGAGATRSLEEGADTIIWLATEPVIPTGKFFSNREEMPW
jgi:NAD(P)-dependent dehydrogenase (short-subunit alcohol dehydrogenase family)